MHAGLIQTHAVIETSTCRTSTSEERTVVSHINVNAVTEEKVWDRPLDRELH